MENAAQSAEEADYNGESIMTGNGSAGGSGNNNSGNNAGEGNLATDSSYTSDSSGATGMTSAPGLQDAGADDAKPSASNMPEEPYGTVDAPPAPSAEDNAAPVDEPDTLLSREEAEVRDLLSEFSDAYAWIEITGELPELLGAYDALPAGGWLDWDVYYTIPRDTARELIAGIKGREEVAITYVLESSDYALVLYKSPQR